MKKLHKKSQMLLYAVSGMGVNMLNLMFGSYLCSALLAGGFADKVLPFQTYIGKDLVVAAVWAVFVLVAKIIDGIIDIPMASFADNLRTRWGRRRPSLIIGFIPMVVAYLLFLVIPDPTGATIVNTIYYGIVLCMFYIFYTLTMVTYYATFTEIVETERERTIISNTKAVCDILYFILGYVVVRMMLNSMNVRLVALIVLPLSLTMTIPMFMIKEPSNRKRDGNEDEKVKSVSLVKSIGYTFRNKTFIVWMVVYSLMSFGLQLFLGGINEYFSFVGLNMVFVMMASFAPVPLALIWCSRIQRRKGFGAAYRFALISFTVGMLMLFFVGLMPQGSLKSILSIVSGLVCSLAVGSMFSVSYSIPSQLAADESEATGVSNSAMYFAIQGLFSGIATGIATGIVLVALKGKGDSASDAI